MTTFLRANSLSKAERDGTKYLMAQLERSQNSPQQRFNYRLPEYCAEKPRISSVAVQQQKTVHYQTPTQPYVLGIMSSSNDIEAGHQRARSPTAYDSPYPKPFENNVKLFRQLTTMRIESKGRSLSPDATRCRANKIAEQFTPIEVQPIEDQRKPIDETAQHINNEDLPEPSTNSVLPEPSTKSVLPEPSTKSVLSEPSTESVLSEPPAEPKKILINDETEDTEGLNTFRKGTKKNQHCHFMEELNVTIGDPYYTPQPYQSSGLNRYVILPGGVYAKPEDIYIESIPNGAGRQYGGCLAMRMDSVLIRYDALDKQYVRLKEENERLKKLIVNLEKAWAARN